MELISEKIVTVRMSKEQFLEVDNLREQGINISKIIRKFLKEFYERNKKAIKII